MAGWAERPPVKSHHAEGLGVAVQGWAGRAASREVLTGALGRRAESGVAAVLPCVMGGP